MSKSTVLLAIETATSACSAALSVGGQVFKKIEVGNNIHSTALLGMIQNLLAENEVEIQQVSGIVVGQGPGSFTGLRIGIGVAQGLAYGIGCQLYGVSSLNALAQQHFAHSQEFNVIAGIDARMGEIYYNAYSCEETDAGVLARAMGGVGLSKPEDLSLERFDQLPIVPESSTEVGTVLVGNAWKEYSDQLPESLVSNCRQNTDIVYPCASYLIAQGKIDFEQGKGVSPMDFKADYIRNDVAKRSTRKGLSFV